MDVLQQTYTRDPKSPGQKIILKILIVAIVLCIIVACALVYLKIVGGIKVYSIAVNGNKLSEEEAQLFVQADNGKTYIPLKFIAEKLGYEFYNGEYKITGEEKDKCYVNNKTNITQFFLDTQEIYKASENPNIDYEYHELQNPILSMDDNLYICMDDLNMALNVVISYSSKDNQTLIEAPSYWYEKMQESLNQKGMILSDDPQNLQALAYGYIVVNKDGKYGVIDFSGQEVIGNKYTSMKFVDYKKSFIIADEYNKFGVIAENGVERIRLLYDSIEILNYNPLLYRVGKGEKFGIMLEDGRVINDTIFDSMGYPEDKDRGIDYTLFIPEINENIPESVVVCNNEKYGLIDLNDGKEILPCILDGIFSVTEGENKNYFVEAQGRRLNLESFVKDYLRLISNL